MRKKLNSIILILAVGLSCISILTTSTNVGDWSEDIRLTFNDARSIGPAIAVEGNNVHVVYADNEGGGKYDMFLWYINSSDRGNTWNSPICLVNGPPTRISLPKIAVNGINIHVIWLDRNDKKIHYIRSTDNGNTWSIERALTSMAYTSTTNWDIGIFENNLHVVYIDQNYKLSYIQSNDNGITWSVPKVIVPSISRVIESAIAVNENNIYIAFRVTRDRMGKLVGDILYVRSIDNGANWDSEIDISIVPGVDTSSDFPDITVDDDDIFIVYRDNDQGGRMQVYLSHSSDNGVTWDKGIRLSNSTSFIVTPAIAAESNDICAVWEDFRDRNFELYVKSNFNKGTTWSADMRLTNTPESSGWPDIVINEKIVHVVWTEGTPPYREIYYKWMSIPLSVISASVDIKPDTLNLKSKGRWITAYIELPDGYDVNDINITTILLENAIPAEHHPTEIGDYDNDGNSDLMVKFDRSDVEDCIGIPMDPVTFTITGDMVTGESFEGDDTVRAILPP